MVSLRYWYPLIPPLVIGAFGALAVLLRRYRPALHGVSLSAAAASLLALVVLVPGTIEFRSCAAKDVWRNDPVARWDDLRNWLETPAAARYRTIRTDNLTARLLPAFRRTVFGSLVWHGQVKKFGRPPATPCLCAGSAG